MDCDEIARLLRADLPDCEVEVSGGGGKFTIAAVGSIFAGLSAVKRQRKVYAIIGGHIASGAIHAVSMNLKTPEETQALG